jgi:hypothetical protein
VSEGSGLRIDAPGVWPTPFARPFTECRDVLRRYSVSWTLLVDSRVALHTAELVGAFVGIRGRKRTRQRRDLPIALLCLALAVTVEILCAGASGGGARW